MYWEKGGYFRLGMWPKLGKKMPCVPTVRAQLETCHCVSNVLGQLEEEAVKVCQCPQTSPIVEDLIAVAPLPHLTKLFQMLHKDSTFF